MVLEVSQVATSIASEIEKAIIGASSRTGDEGEEKEKEEKGRSISEVAWSVSSLEFRLLRFMGILRALKVFTG